ncbi:hypothetical protein [Pseudoalteromonas byunsanensis]|uniref:Uncharacterized protein n=1 Tax=Pseudoalteromonas byunsanensis TaxID=327939 RepID=A0A1S1N7G8_9GAMM|nr:hypothetical protein [Pseudoalteromonas byunsanensis]OHU97167.1 hypothetical protein BIW53_02275 [Pseudoalteromonas byunsanensis]
MNNIRFCVTQRNQSKQSRVLLFVQSINYNPAFNVGVFTQLKKQFTDAMRTNLGMCNGTGFIVNTQPFKAIIKLVTNVVGLHGLIPRFQDDQILASAIYVCEVPKNVCFWNGFLASCHLQNGGCHD